MATVNCNGFVNSISGKMGQNVVFRTLKDKTIIAKRPARPSRESGQQKANRGRFREATIFAKEAMKDPEKKAYYWKKARKFKLPNAYTAAITDYMRTPTVSIKKRQADSIIVVAEKRGFALSKISVINKENQTKSACSQIITKEFSNGEYIKLGIDEWLRIEDCTGRKWRFDTRELVASAGY